MLANWINRVRLHGATYPVIGWSYANFHFQVLLWGHIAPALPNPATFAGIVPVNGRFHMGGMVVLFITLPAKSVILSCWQHDANTLSCVDSGVLR